MQEKSTEISEEYNRCKNGHGEMSGEEYFFYNYFKIDGKLPAPGSFNRELFEFYKQKQLSGITYWNRRRRGNIINDWLEVYGSKEISDQVRMEIKEGLESPLVAVNLPKGKTTKTGKEQK